MTTIIADLRCERPTMIADNQMMAPGSNSSQPCRKLFRIKDGPNAGHIVGTAGYVCPCLIFINWYTQKAERDWSDPSSLARVDLDLEQEDFDCLILRPAGIFAVDRFFIPYRLECRYYASGSGTAYALGAMDQGASIQEALTIACHRDVHTSKMGRSPQLLTL